MVKKISDEELQMRIAVLRKVSFLSETETDILRTIARVIEEWHVHAGEFIFKKGDIERCMYIIVTGKVNVHDGDHVFTVLQDGDFFGEYSLIEASERSASVSAVDDTKLLRLDEDVFYGFIREQNKLIQGVLKSLINRVKDKDMLEEKLAKKNAEIQKQHDILQKQSKELEELNKTKDRFFSIIAHDLRSPFSVTLGYTDLLMKRFDYFTTEQIKEFIGQINNSAQKQFKLLENLLQWSRIQIGSLKVEPSELNLKYLNDNVITLLEINARKKDINLFSMIKDDIKVFADENMVTTVLRNLVSNAIKFTNRGGYVNLYSRPLQNEVEVTVKDNGIGISNDNIDKLFKINTNSSTPGTEDESGTGLGLILCKEFVEKNGGKIWAESKIGEGTAMKFTLPVKK